MRVEHPRYPGWAPPYIAEEMVQLLDRANDSSITSDQRASARNMVEMWERLATRTDMESFWKWYESVDCPHPQHQKSEIVIVLNWHTAQFENSPKLSVKEYQNEMLAIEKMANDLAKRIKKFRGAPGTTAHLFPASSMLTHEDTEWAGEIIRDELLSRPFDLHRPPELLSSPWKEGVMLRRRRNVLDLHLPAVDTQLQTLAQQAHHHSKQQYFRLRLPRKVNDKNVFRTYFIGVVQDYLFGWHGEFSPSRIATFCSVALGDDRIDGDLVSKLSRVKR